MRNAYLLPDHTLDVIPRTTEEITISLGAWTTEISLTIPEGTPCVSASNISAGGYWLDPRPEQLPEGDSALASWIAQGIRLGPDLVAEL